MRRLLFSGATAVASLLGLFSASGTAYASNPTIWSDLKTGIGLSASRVQILVTTPFCVTLDGAHRKVVSIDPAVGAPSDFFTMANDDAGCVEEKVAISPGMGGFLPNYVYVSQGPDIFKITPDGSSGSFFTNLPGVSGTNVAITFDTDGAFGYKMIVTGGDSGMIYTVDSAGNAIHLTTITDLGGNPVHIESSEVITSGFWKGELLMGAEVANTIYAVDHLGNFSAVGTAFPEAESVHEIPSPALTFMGSAYAFFEAVHGPDRLGGFGHIRAYPATDFSGLGGKILAVSEDFGFIDSLNNDATLSNPTTFDNGVPQIPSAQEGSSFVSNIPLGCTFTLGWYKNRGSGSVVPLTLGSQAYTAAQLSAILGANPGQYKEGHKSANGLVSLAQQLITEKLNALGGAAVPQVVVNAVHAADALIGSLVVPPVGTGYLDSAATSGLESTLDQFNEGGTLYWPAHCSN